MYDVSKYIKVYDEYVIRYIDVLLIVFKLPYLNAYSLTTNIFFLS